MHRVLRSGHVEDVLPLLESLAAADPELAWATYPHGAPERPVEVISLSGPRAAAAAERVAAVADVYTFAELLDAVDRATSDDELERALVALASGAPDGRDDAVLERLVRALRHRSARVRAWTLGVSVPEPVIQVVAGEAMQFAMDMEIISE